MSSQVGLHDIESADNTTETHIPKMPPSELPRAHMGIPVDRIMVSKSFQHAGETV